MNRPVIASVLLALAAVPAGIDARQERRFEQGFTQKGGEVDIFNPSDITINIFNRCDDPQTILVQGPNLPGTVTVPGDGTATLKTVYDPAGDVMMRTDGFARVGIYLRHRFSASADGTRICEDAELNWKRAEISMRLGEPLKPGQHYTVPPVQFVLTQRYVKVEEPEKVVPTTPNQPLGVQENYGLYFDPTPGAGPDDPKEPLGARPPKLDIDGVHNFDTFQPLSAPEQTVDSDPEEVMDVRAPWRWLQNVASFLRAAGVRTASLAGDDRFAVPLSDLPPRLVRVQTSARAKPFDSRDVLVSFVATGEATGETLRPRISNRSGRRVRVIFPDGLVLRSTGQTTRPPADAPGARNVIGYCAEFAKLPPPAGTIFEMAPQSMQRRYQSMRSVLSAARQAADAGGLKSGGGREAYLHSLTQWSAWTKLERWTDKDFAKHFVDKAKENLARGGQKWTKEIEKAVSADVPLRWADVRNVLDRAAATDRPKAGGDR